jgi:hypothetical protein
MPAPSRTPLTEVPRRPTLSEAPLTVSGVFGPETQRRRRGNAQTIEAQEEEVHHG